MKRPKIKRIDELYSTKFLSFQETIYKDKNGKEQKWDFVARTKNAAVVTIIAFDKNMRKLIFIKQPRVVINKIVWGFPAGLFEPGK